MSAYAQDAQQAAAEAAKAMEAAPAAEVKIEKGAEDCHVASLLAMT